MFSTDLFTNNPWLKALLIILAMVAILFSIAETYSRLHKLFPEKNTKFQLVPGQEEYYRKIQPFE